MVDQIAIPWAVYVQDVANVAAQIQNANVDCDVIVAIARGGLVPATIVAHQLAIRTIDVIDIRSYLDDNTQQAVRVQRSCAPELIERGGARVVVVDDMIDSGKTFDAVRAILPRAHYAVAYARRSRTRDVDFFAREMPEDVWVVFPYEAPER